MAAIPPLGPAADEAFKTYGERLLEEGEQKGKKEGEVVGARRLLMQQLVEKFEKVPQSIRDKVTQAEPAQLEAWGKRLVKLDDLESVFGDD